MVGHLALALVLAVPPADPGSAANGVAAAGSVQAAAPPQAPATDPPAKTPPPADTAGWRDGFFVQSDDGGFRLQIGLLAHADGRFALGDNDDTLNDTFLIRRARAYLRGRLGQRFEFYFNPDFAGGTLVLQDAYLDTIFSPVFRIRVGKAKAPVGLERLHSASNTLFLERALPTSLVPNRDVGIQVLGDLSGGLVSYQAGVSNGVADGGSGDGDSNDGKEAAGRVLARPFNGRSGSPLRGLSVAFAASAGRQSGAIALPALRTPSLQQTYFSYSGATADGVRTRYSPQVSYYYKAFGAFAEYVHSSLPVRRGGVTDDVGHAAWQVAGSFVLTGEAATDASAGVRPRAGFDFGHGHPGALQVAARYHTLAVDEVAITRNLAAFGSSRKADAWTVGLNWYLTAHVRYVLNFERTVFDEDADGARRAENGLVFRAQVAF